jgi:hypothetical protein
MLKIIAILGVACVASIAASASISAIKNLTSRPFDPEHRPVENLKNVSSMSRHSKIPSVVDRFCGLLR